MDGALEVVLKCVVSCVSASACQFVLLLLPLGQQAVCMIVWRKVGEKSMTTREAVDIVSSTGRVCI